MCPLACSDPDLLAEETAIEGCFPLSENLLSVSPGVMPGVVIGVVAFVCSVSLFEFSDGVAELAPDDIWHSDAFGRSTADVCFTVFSDGFVDDLTAM